jgi:leucyl/phenylalanyl-tRNA--protein transferase
VLLLDKARAPKKLQRLVAREPFEIRVDSDFAAVIEGCAEPKAGREETWINDPIHSAFTELFRLGYAHTVECWKDGALVGGVYGVALGGAFFAESMFSRADNASKVALVHLVRKLKAGGFRLLDAQFATEHLKQFGVEPMPNAEYQALLKEALAVEAKF